MDNVAKQANIGAAVKALPGGLVGPKQQQQLTIVKVENGYTITPPYYDSGETKVAISLTDVTDIVTQYFLDKENGV